MDELLRFYKVTLGSLAGLTVTVVLLVPRVIAPYLQRTLGSNHWATSIANFMTSQAFIAGLLIVGEWVIRKWWWRIVHPELNFAGVWDGESKYNRVHIGSPPSLPPPAGHTVKFDQDCISFAMAPTQAKPYANWGAYTITFKAGGRISYAYWVKYTDPSFFPTRTIGYEELDVTARGWRGRPTQLTGDFYHCATGLDPVYSGVVMFKRRPWWKGNS